MAPEADPQPDRRRSDPHRKVSGRLLFHSDELDSWLDTIGRGESIDCFLEAVDTASEAIGRGEMTFRKPSPALIVALIALFVAMSSNGTASRFVKGKGAAAVKAASASRLDARGPRGPRGPRGRRGPQGPAGPPGPTMSAVAGSAMNPPPHPDRLWEDVRPDTPRRGNLFVMAHVESATLTCGDNAPCSVHLGLYVDDAPIEHTDRVLTSDCSAEPCVIRVFQQDLFGSAAGVASGSHRVQLCSRTLTGTIADFSEEGGEIAAILLGA